MKIEAMTSLGEIEADGRGNYARLLNLPAFEVLEPLV
jgi:hypothetical protein